MNADCPEDVVDAFKAAALSVTKLFKTAAAAQAKAHTEGYQDCLNDLLSFLNKEKMGLSDGEGLRVRAWATERMEGGDGGAQTAESEDEVEKAETASSPELQQASNGAQLPVMQDALMQSGPAPDPIPLTKQESSIIVPAQETFNFVSSIPYPQDADVALAALDLSDNNSSPRSNTAPPSAAIPIKPTRLRLGGSGARTGAKSLGRGAGLKRKLNLGEIFDVGSLGYGKDMFGNRGNKRRHI